MSYDAFIFELKDAVHSTLSLAELRADTPSEKKINTTLTLMLYLFHIDLKFTLNQFQNNFSIIIYITRASRERHLNSAEPQSYD